MSDVLVVTGFNREVATLPKAGIRAIAGGGDGRSLKARIEAIADGACAIASYGMTGALSDGLSIGEWVVGARIAGSTDLECDPAWRDAIAARLPGSRIGGFFADGRMIDTVEEKLSLGREFSALAVDMESHIAAGIAAERGLPFAIVRCVSDEARHLLPHAITVSMRPDGAVDGRAMIGSLVRRPAQIADVMRTGIGFARAMRALKDGAARLGPRVAFPDTRRG